MSPTGRFDMEIGLLLAHRRPEPFYLDGVCNLLPGVFGVIGNAVTELRSISQEIADDWLTSERGGHAI